MVNIPGVLRAQRRAARPEVVEFLPVASIFKAQSAITMLKDVTGWVNNDKATGKKWHFNTGKKYYVDYDVADSFIIKGYAEGRLSRNYSEEEMASMQSTVTHLNVGVSNG